MYRQGEGVPPNDAEALKWFRLAADQGNASAQFFLGLIYQFGRGVPPNVRKKDYLRSPRRSIRARYRSASRLFT